jgi:hypothetical protein
MRFTARRMRGRYRLDVSTLRSVLEELQAEDLAISSDVELGEDLVELERASRVLEAERSRRLGGGASRGLGRGRSSLGCVVAHRQIEGGVLASLPAGEARESAPLHAGDQPGDG